MNKDGRSSLALNSKLKLLNGNWIIFSLLLVIMLAASLPFFHQKLFYTHDFLHAARVAEMSRALGDLHLPPRWSQNFGFGYGMPLFEFYAPLPFFVGGVFFLLGFDIFLIIQLLYLISTIIAVLGAYLLGKEVFGNKWSGVVSALVFGLAPYRAVNIFVRGALSELWGMMFMPFVLYFGIKLLRKRSASSWFGLVLSTTGLILSHNLSALIFIPLGFGFLAVLALFANRAIFNKDFGEIFRNLALLVLGTFFAFGLSAFYFLPALLEKGFTQVDQTVVGGYFDFRVHFVGLGQLFDPYFGYGGSGFGPDDGMTFFIGYASIIGAFLTAAVVIFWHGVLRHKLSEKLIVVILSGFFALFSLFLLHSKSEPIWSQISILEYTQFPWRFLSVASLFLAIFSAGFVGYMSNMKKGKQLLAASVVVLGVVSIVFAASIFKPEEYLSDSDEYFFGDETRIRTESSPVLPDYLPLGLDKEISPADVDTLLASHSADIEVLSFSQKTHQKRLSVISESENNISLAIANFPGWRVYLDSVLFDHSSDKNGLISFSIPNGKSEILAKFESTTVRKIADTISALSLVCLAAIAIISKTKRINAK